MTEVVLQFAHQNKMLLWFLGILAVVIFFVKIIDKVDPEGDEERSRNWELRQSCKEGAWSYHDHFTFPRGGHIYIDHDNQWIGIFKGGMYGTKVNISSVSRVIPVIDGHQESTGNNSLPGAVAGGLLLGGVGVIAGAVAGMNRNYNYVRKMSYVFMFNGSRVECVFVLNTKDKNVIRDAYKKMDAIRDRLAEAGITVG